MPSAAAIWETLLGSITPDEHADASELLVAEQLESISGLLLASTMVVHVHQRDVNGYADPGNFTVNQGQFLSFGGTASDGVGLSVITVKVSSPKVTDYTASTASVSGTSKSLSAYGFDTGNSTYAGAGGSYTVTIFAKDSSNNVSFRTWNFTVVCALMLRRLRSQVRRSTATPIRVTSR